MQININFEPTSTSKRYMGYISQAALRRNVFSSPFFSSLVMTSLISFALHPKKPSAANDRGLRERPAACVGRVTPG